MINVVQQVIAVVFMVPVALVFERHGSIVPNLSLVGALGYLVLVISIAASLLWFWILGKGEASTVGVYLFLSPVFGLIFAALVLGEKLHLRDGLGLLIVSAGVALVRWGSPAPKPPDPPRPTIRPPSSSMAPRPPARASEHPQTDSPARLRENAVASPLES
jgi:drug/metabolite transporter (DMT)-like permease